MGRSQPQEPVSLNAQDTSVWPGLGKNLARIESQIAAASRHSARNRSEVTLTAVTKGHPYTAIAGALALGLTSFGENRVQEFQEKHAALCCAIEPEIAATARFHLIGHLQSNKSSRAVELFSSIDTVDSLRLAERLNDAALRLERRMPVLLEIKLSHEESKEGLDPGATELQRLLERMPDLRALELQGLMTVPPYLEDLEAVRPYFSNLRKLRDRLAAQHPRLNFAELSMGMSHDFAVAIEEGSTQVRIGTALFGTRNRV